VARSFVTRDAVPGRWTRALRRACLPARSPRAWRGAGKHFARAVTLYTSALDALPSAILFANRAAAQLALENYGSALADAESSVTLEPSYIKGYYRRAAARFLLGKYNEALRDYRLVVKLKPADKDAQLKLKECERVVKALRFASAIANPEEDEVRRRQCLCACAACSVRLTAAQANIAESIDLSSMGEPTRVCAAAARVR
jgi:tetratricopeptide (TPR) repeat protein